MTPISSSCSSSGSRSNSIASPPSGSTPDESRYDLDIRDYLAKDRNGHLVPRQRKWAPKKRTGCLTCRARHLKCDEAKPICGRCKLAGRECGGYTESASSAAPVPLKPRRLKQTLAPEGVQATSQDWHMFDLFRTVTVYQVSGGIDQSFWSSDMLRAAHSYPAIWHASLALAGMHEWMKHSAFAAVTGSAADADSAQKYYTFGLGQYNASISHVLSITRQQDLSYASKETLLMTSMLYAGICCLQSNTVQALVHIRNAVEIFCQWRFWEYADKAASKRQQGLLNPNTMVRLATTFYYQFRDLVDDDPTVLAAAQQHRQVSRTKKPFASPTEAYYELLTILHMEAICPDCGPSDPHDTATQKHPRKNAKACIQHVFAYWKTRFRGLQEACRNEAPLTPPSSPPSTDSQESQVMQLLEIFEDVFEALYLDKSHQTWAKLEPRFHRAVDAAEHLLIQQASSSESSIPSQAPIFSFSLSILEVLTMIGIVSRNGPIRRRVTALLEAWPRIDGVVSSRLIKLIVETIIRREDDECALHRDLNMDMALDPDLKMDSSGCDCEMGVYVCKAHQVEDVVMCFLEDRMVKVGVRTHEDVVLGVPAKQSVYLV